MFLRPLWDSNNKAPARVPCGNVYIYTYEYISQPYYRQHYRGHKLLYAEGPLGEIGFAACVVVFFKA